MVNGLSKNMVNYITDRKSKKEVLKGFEPLIRKWFNSKFDDLTPPQSMAVPLIHNKEIFIGFVTKVDLINFYRNKLN